MSTRGVIARWKPSQDGELRFVGRYLHWDNYPTGTGATLYSLYQGYFKKDIGKMLAFLIDKHKAGWSTINGADFSKPAGYCEDIAKRNEMRLKGETFGPACFCCGDRHEKPSTMTEKNAAACGCEWGYVFDEKTNKMYVCSSFHRDGNKAIGYFGCGDENAIWKPIAAVDLNDKEPDWEVIEKNGETALRPIINFV